MNLGCKWPGAKTASLIRKVGAAIMFMMALSAKLSAFIEGGLLNFPRHIDLRRNVCIYALSTYRAISLQKNVVFFVSYRAIFLEDFIINCALVSKIA